MKVNYLAPLLCIGVLALTGCNDPKKPSESNFKEAAQQYLDTVYPACYIKANFPYGVLGIFRPKTTKCSGGPAVCGLQRGITFFEIPIWALFE